MENEEQGFENIFDQYVKDSSHYSLKKCLENTSSSWRSDPIFGSSDLGFNLIVHTLSNRHQVNQCIKLIDETATLHLLSWLTESMELVNIVTDFFNTSNSASLLAFYVDKLEDNFIVKRIQMI
jgi:hypothetical protein